jgi:hypothetical protein
MAWGGIDRSFAPLPAVLATEFRGALSCRPGADPQVILAWEERHGHRLPWGLRAWLSLSNGLFGSGPFIHPVNAIRPARPFAGASQAIDRPDSWFELGKPNGQAIYIDLGYRFPGGSYPIYSAKDNVTGSLPRIIARSFEEWLLALLRDGGREYWLDRRFQALTEPWQAHRPLPVHDVSAVDVDGLTGNIQRPA